MTTQTGDAPPRSAGFVLRALAVIERVGNKLPHPFWLFVILTAAITLISWLLSALDVSVVSPADGETVAVQSLVSEAGARMMVEGAIENFVTFPPLGVILVVMLGVAVADKAGLLAAILRAALSRVPARLVTFVIAFTGMISHIASDAAFVVMIPLGAIAYRSIGRSPMLGAVVAFVAVSGGNNASPLVTGSDAMLAGLTTAAAHTIDPDYLVTPVATYYFSLVSSIVLSVVITVVVETVLKRRVAAMNAESPEQADTEDLPDLTLSADERRGLRNAGITAVVIIGALVLAMVPTGSPLRGEAGEIVASPLIQNIAVFLALLFFGTGVAYGRAVGVVRAARDIPDLMAHGVRELAPIMVLFFAVSQFLAYFRWTGLGEVIAISGARSLESIGVSPLVLFLGFIVLVSLMNLIITSGSAMWSLIGPILVPMLMLLDIPPEVTWALYRIADSCTNCITPMSPYFVLALGFIRRYRPNAGIGTLISLTLPIAMSLLVAWVLLFLAWYALGIPLGPGAPIP
ncbi:AbgT family transporter [Nocardiopsis sediminis]|uniref:AbgT family transporter n=1 Tax=Nocardiopsis sediminis TaxID=1778267 RepID=A0ABV8FFL6_9ACTN